MKAADRAEKMRSDVPAMVKSWLTGITNQMQKLGEAMGAASSLKDEAIKNQYISRFASHHKELQDLRRTMEDSGVTKTKPMMDTAKRQVETLRTDLTAFNKLKSVYGKPAANESGAGEKSGAGEMSGAGNKSRHIE